MMEKWDLYTKNRENTGITINRGENIPEGMYRLVVHVAVFNQEGKMLIQKRQKNKSRWANLWDLSVGGHVVSGENTREAAVREAQEELGLDIDLSDKPANITTTFNNGFDDYYIVTVEVKIEDIIIQQEEVSEVRWASLSEIKEFIRTNKFIAYHESFVELLFFLRNHSEIHTDME